MTPSYQAPNRIRRTLVGGIAVGYASLFIPKSFAADAVPTTTSSAFLALSELLTGRTDLDNGQAEKLLDALIANDAQFAPAMLALNAFVAQRKPDPAQLQQLLDTEKQPFAALPRQIVSAWFIGVVGAGVKARCLTYASSLMNVMVADHLRPPSYAYGAYGTWSVKPA